MNIIDQQDDSTNTGVTYNKFGVPIASGERMVVPEVSAPEVIKPVEKLPTTETNTKDNQNKIAPVTSDQTTPQQNVNIVDVSTHKEKLHKLTDTANPITKKADEEEEDFIEKVETAHDHT